jgi:hypothetical protein
MIELNRRELFGVGGVGVVGISCCGSVNAQANESGCWVPPNQVSNVFSRVSRVATFASGSEQLEPRSGNRELDRALARSLAKIARMFDVLPAFGFYDDGNAPNARATDQVMAGNADGTVLFGLSFLRNLLQGPYRPDASIVAVCAHEFGHILSYKRGIYSQLNPDGASPFRGEQFADFMAGYFAGQRKRETPSFPAAVFAATQNYFGGGDHGTSAQRGAAVQRGYMVAYEQNLSINEATQAALNYSMAQRL